MMMFNIEIDVGTRITETCRSRRTSITFVLDMSHESVDRRQIHTSMRQQQLAYMF
jgi:hypothetical protein